MTKGEKKYSAGDVFECNLYNRTYSVHGTRQSKVTTYHRAYDSSKDPYGIADDNGLVPYRSRGWVAKTLHDTKREATYWDARYDCVILSADEVMDADMSDPRNSDYYAKRVQASIFKSRGYIGPLNGGVARGLANAFKAISMEDMVKRGWCHSTKSVQRWGTNYDVSRFSYCYQFRSPRPDVTVKDFVRLVKACKKDNARFAKAVQYVIDTPNVTEMLGTLDVLDVLKGMK